MKNIKILRQYVHDRFNVIKIIDEETTLHEDTDEDVSHNFIVLIKENGKEIVKTISYDILQGLDLYAVWSMPGDFRDCPTDDYWWLHEDIRIINGKITHVAYFDKSEDSSKKDYITFEIEDYNGNTIMAFMYDKKNNLIVDTKDCSHADTDEDYIFETGNDNFRIQSDVK